MLRLVLAPLLFSSALSFIIHKSVKGSNTCLYAKPQQDVTDLNLEQMFDVFNKADVTVKLPKANEIDYRNAEKSQSVPFLIAPTNLKGLPGYKSFDPWFFSNTLDVKWLQEAGYAMPTTSYFQSKLTFSFL